MFWGLLLEPGKRYSTTVEKSFHVSKAALDCSSVKNENEILSVILETEGSEALLCNLCKQKGILQENLDLNFMTGDRLTFECRGHGRIHLTGYLLPDDDDDMSGMLGDEESEEEEEESNIALSPGKSGSPEKSKKDKRKADVPPNVPAKKKKPTESNNKEDDDESESMESESDGGLEDDDLDDEEVEEEEDESSKDDDDDDDEESEEDEDEELPVNTSQKNKQKQQVQNDKNKTPKKQNLNASVSKKTPVTNGISPKEQKSNKKTPVGNKTPNATNTTPKQKQVLEQGVIVKELKIGTGAPAKPGKMVQVYYLGKLKENGKVFDKQLKGEGFQFKLGKGEVIKGWDIGLQGMKVGGKRIIHCPPETAYGSRGAPPKIPANSSLIFEIELKGVQ